MNMNSGANKTFIQVIKESKFGGTYFRDTFSGVKAMEKIWWAERYWSEALLLELWWCYC